MRLPHAPCGDGPSMVGLRVKQIETPEALALEGATQNHCVATWLPRVWEGRAWVFAVRQGGTRMTVALARDAHGRLRIEEARLADNARPSTLQMGFLQAWIDRLNKAELSDADRTSRIGLPTSTEGQ
jgi:hypothetical protein